MKKISLSKDMKIHMAGVNGVSVSGMALVMSEMGYKVTGCDLKPGDFSDRVKAAGIRVYSGHDPSHVDEADVIVASAAVPNSHPELVYAREKGIPVLTRAEMLGLLMEGKRGVAVAGTHGKTTTTSMIGLILEAAGLDPTVMVGGDVGGLHGNAKLGRSELFVTEACEAFNSFLELAPNIAVVTNIEAEHLDTYGTLEGVMESFRKFLSNVENGGCAIMCIDCPNVTKIIPSIECEVVTYGLNADADYSAEDVIVDKMYPSFSVRAKDRSLGVFTLKVPGIHNVENALAAIAVADGLGIAPDVVRSALSGFTGAGRRFEILGSARGITVVDDYAHHPTEIKATIAAARTWGRRVVAAFQPHLYSRTHLFATGFAESLKGADEIFITEIYPAREKPIPGVSAKMIADLINGEAVFVADKANLAKKMLPMLKSGDIVVIMGAGDIRNSAEELLALLRNVND